MSKYYVYNPKRGKPNYIHNTRKKALEEAKRLAKKTNETFEVLKIVSVVEIEPRIKVREYLKDNENKNCTETKGDN